MTDYLEKTIRENKSAFDEEPLDGHFDRFESRLDKMHGKKKPGWKTYLQIAAGLLLAVLLVNQGRMYLSKGEPEPVNLAQIAPEYAEAEFYFTSSIDKGLAQWNRLFEEGHISKEEQKMMVAEMEEFDKMKVELEVDLKANPNDERVINAMLEYYQAKLSVITLIIEKLEDVKQQKLTKYETEV